MRGFHISKCYDHSLMVCDTIIVRWIGTVSEEPTACTLKMHGLHCVKFKKSVSLPRKSSGATF